MTPAPTSCPSREAQLSLVLEACADERVESLAGDLRGVADGLLAHGVSVAALALAVGRGAGLADGRLAVLARAALLHDVGKRLIPTIVLDKPAELAAHERQIVEAHSSTGASILLEAGMVEESAIVRHHHERWDGTGYPDRLFGDAIPQASRIIAAADAFDAMTSDRPYRPALPVDLALAEIALGAGSQFDPECARLLLEVV